MEKREKVKRFAYIVKQRLSGAELQVTSVMIAYYLMLSFVPLLIVVGNILPLFNVEAEIAVLYLGEVIPDMVMPAIEPIIRDLLTTTSGGLLSLGLLTGIWSASRGITYIRKGLNKAYGVSDSASYIVKKIVSVVTIVLILLLLILFALVFGFSGVVLEGLAPYIPWAGSLLQQISTLKWPVSLLFIFALLVLVYRATPDVKLRVRDVLLGSAFAAGGLIGLVQAFSLYLQFFSRNLSSYGTLGAFFVMIIWLNFSAGILILGAVLNASISEYRFGAAQKNVSGMDNAVERAKSKLLQRWNGLFSPKEMPKPEDTPSNLEENTPADDSRASTNSK